ncbi:MAG: phosphate/phosphite/phosphonate ABC transporter substrate-binding protein [Calditrichaeota bacterium]|nr:phosphate/phosphite/phosphonate ABC transporter substrate-binding protein [Calditrichota bacterium]
MFRISSYTILIVSLALIATLACDSNHLHNQKPTPIDLTTPLRNNRPDSLASNKPRMYVAVSAMISPKETFTYYQDLMAYLSEKMGYDIQFRQRKTYKEVNDMLRENQLDFAFICSGAYVRAVRQFPLEILVVPVVNGEPFYHSYIIVHKDSEINSVSQLRGRSFAFTDPFSNSGYLYMADLLKKMGETPESFFQRTIFTYAHDYSIQAVSRKIVDGACVESLIFEYLKTYEPERTKDVKIIKVSDGFGIPPVVVPNSLPVERKEKLRQTFISMHQDSVGKTILKKLLIDRFERADLKNYRSVDNMLRNITQ